MLTDYRNFFTDRLISKFATIAHYNIPPHLKYVATLPDYLVKYEFQKTGGNLKYVL